MPQSPTCHAPGGRDRTPSGPDPWGAKIGRQEADSMATSGGPRRAGRFCTRSAQ